MRLWHNGDLARSSGLDLLKNEKERLHVELFRWGILKLEIVGAGRWRWAGEAAAQDDRYRDSLRPNIIIGDDLATERTLGERTHLGALSRGAGEDKRPRGGHH